MLSNIGIEERAVRDLLLRSEKRMRSNSVGDASALVAEANAAYGLARIAWSLQRRGIDPGPQAASGDYSGGVETIFSPDGGVTRNKERWAAGYGYGCLLRWPGPADGAPAITFPMVKPNACGMLVCRLDGEAPSPGELAKRISGLTKLSIPFAAPESEQKAGLADSSMTALKINLGVSNHFVEVYHVTESGIPGLVPGDRLAVLHTSPNELKDELYDFDHWARLAAGSGQGGWEETPLGPHLVLEDSVALHYFDTYQAMERFSEAKRVAIAEALFPGSAVLCDATHQGMPAVNEVALGVYTANSAGWTGPGFGDARIFPLTLRSDLPLYLMRLGPVPGKTNGWGPAILPHGGGYKLLFDGDFLGTERANGRTYFRFSTPAGSEFVFSNPRELPYDYRGLEVLERITQRGLGEVAASARQLYTLKY